MSVLDRETLEKSKLADLHALASEMSIDGYRRLRKEDLIDALVAHQGGDGQSDSADGATNDADAGTGAEGGQGSGRSRRSRGRGGRGRGAGAQNGAAGDEDRGEEDRGSERRADDPAAESDQRTAAAAEGEPGGNESGGNGSSRRRRGRGRGRGSENGGDASSNGERSERSSGGERAEEKNAGEGQRESREGRESRESREPREPIEIVSGTVELLPGGSGFLRLVAGEQSDADVYISGAQVKRCELINGDVVTGPRRGPHRSERFASLVRIDSVNGNPAAEIAERTRFSDLPAEFPKTRFKLATGDVKLKQIDTITPIGYGSRVVICGESMSGKSTLLAAIGAALGGAKDIVALTALAGVRPEEITAAAACAVAPVAAVSFSASTEAQEHAAALAVEQGERLAARGANAVVLIDTLDGLSPSVARKLLAAARKIVDGGSLTVIATAEAPLGGETTVISLDREQALLGNHPALDVPASGTIHAELLTTKAAFAAIARERAKLAS